MISRIWHGWTAPANAGAYESLLTQEIFVNIQNRHIDGYRGIQLLRRQLETEVEFVTIMSFDTLDAVRAFAGDDYEVAVIPPQGQGAAVAFRCPLPALRGERRQQVTLSQPLNPTARR